MNVAFQGEIGAYSEEAVLALYPDAKVVPKVSFDAVFESTEAGEVERAVIPIENSLFGSVHVNYDLLSRHELHIVAESYLRIQHHLLSMPGSSMEKIRRVYSHPQAIGQCQDFLKRYLPNAEAISSYDTAGAAKMVAERQDQSLAAIASHRASLEYGLSVLQSGIESNHQNFTRFLALKKLDPSGILPDGLPAPEREEEGMKTSIMYAVKENVPGALFKSLAVFALRDLDLFKIESRPLIGRPGSYIFYLDFKGTTYDEPVKKAIAHLDEITVDLSVLGSYPQAVIA